MIFSFLSSVCLIMLPLFKSLLFFTLFVSIFGLCFGFSKTISYKWLTKNDKKLTNLKTKLVHIQFYFGMFIAFCLVVSILNSQPSSPSSDITTPSTTFLSPPPKLNPNRDPRRKRDSSFNVTTANETTSVATTTSTTTSTKSHVKKPDAADGSYLEQSHITKPQIINNKPSESSTSTTSNISPLTYALNANSSDSLKQCLLELARSCELHLARLNSTLSCKYTYIFPSE